MNWRRVIWIGLLAGLIMGVTLFLAGAVFSRIIYGPQFAPPGKFKPEQLNAWYFIWTKLLIGAFFGLLFVVVYEKLPLTQRLKGGWNGLQYAFVFWLVMTMWNLSHPLVYGSINDRDQLFWLLYSLSGFLAYGFAVGRFYRRQELRARQT